VVNASQLSAGDNLIAVEAHQINITSSDITMGAELLAFVPGGITIFDPRLQISRDANTGQVTITWVGDGILQETTDLENGGTTDWSDVDGNPTSPYIFTPASSRKFFRMR